MAKINVLFRQSTTTVAVGPSVVGPLDFSIVPRNNGAYTTSFWRINVIFCKDISVSKSELKWLLLDPTSPEYAYQSEKPLISIPDSGYFFADTLDSIGNFQIYIPSNKFMDDMPIAMVFSAGERTDAKYSLVMLSKKGGFHYKDIFTQEGHIVPSEVETLVKDCRPLVYEN